MTEDEQEESLLRSVALQNARSILAARRQAEDELLHTKEALEAKSKELAYSLGVVAATLEATTDGILVTDGNGAVAGFNQRFLKMWEVAPELRHPRTHLQLFESIAPKLRKPEEYKSRIIQIYETSSVESFDLLELADGKVFERYSRLQQTGNSSVARVWSFRDITDRKRIEEVRLRLAAIVEYSDDAIITKTLDGIINSWNKGAEQIFGYTAEEAVGQPVTLIIPPDFRHEEPEILEKLGRGERIDHFETVRVRKDGGLLNISVTVSPMKDSEGRVIGASKIARDITERTRSQERLRASEARFRQLADAMPQIVWTAAADGSIDYFNRRWAEFTGLPEGLDKAGDWNSALHPGDVERFRSVWRESVQEGDPFQMEYRLKNARGEFRWHLGQAMAVRGPIGKIVRWYGSSTDVHEQKLTAEALREEYVVTDHLYEVAKALATEIDLEKVVQIITDAGTRVTRAQFGAFFYNAVDEQGGSSLLFATSGVGRKLFEKYPLPRPSELFGRTFPGKGVFRLDDVRNDPRFVTHQADFGIPRAQLPLVSYLAVPVFSRSGEVLGGLFFGHSEPGVFDERDEKILIGIAAQAAAAMDIARTYRAEQKARAGAEQANLAKDHFIATLSHELRTPLTPALAILSDLCHDDVVSPELRQDLETVRRNVELEARLIDDLLDLTRITRGKLVLHRSPVVIDQTIEDAINTCLIDLENKRLRLVRDFVRPAPTVPIDGPRINQILWNLLKNAVKFTLEGGVITIRTRLASGAEGDCLQVEVQDTGIGIEPAHLHRVFDAFEQGDRKITRQFGGLGLGLAISKAIAEAHRGSLKVMSEGTGSGSTFILSLPLSWRQMKGSGVEAARTFRPSAGQTALAGEQQRPLNILLVEDHADTAAILSRFLRRMGHEVTHQRTVSSAIDAAARASQVKPFDLVMSDVGLPDGTGLELMRELSAKYQLSGIALSGFGMEEDLRQSREAGFSQHLVKPIDVSLLRATISEVMRGK